MNECEAPRPYLAACNLRVGDRFAVWPVLDTAPQPAPVRYACNGLLLLVLTFPFRA